MKSFFGVYQTLPERNFAPFREMSRSLDVNPSHFLCNSVVVNVSRESSIILAVARHYSTWNSTELAHVIKLCMTRPAESRLFDVASGRYWQFNAAISSHLENSGLRSVFQVQVFQEKHQDSQKQMSGNLYQAQAHECIEFR